MATTRIAMFLLSMIFSPNSAAPLTPLEIQLLAANSNKTLLNSEFAPSWATTSNIRSTASLLWTCVLTLSICVFTVIHINIPLQNQTSFSYTQRKTKWAIFAILAPELTLATAFQQWSTVRTLKRELNSLSLEQNDGEVDTRAKEKFGTTYCFYAVMGGFVVDVSEIHNYHSVVTLQPLGIVELAKIGYFFEISEEAIKDKSKADTLGKLLVCVQVIWMVIQCIGRKAEGLPTSLLEIHVLVHVFCALCMYAFWIEKPLDIRDPTIIDASRFPTKLALMLLGSSCSGDEPDKLRLYNPYPGSLYNDPIMAPGEEGVHTIVPDQSSVNDQNSPDDIPIITYESPEDTTGRLLHCQWESYSAKCYITLNKGQSLPSGLGIRHVSYSTTLSKRDLNRWTQATISMRQEPEKYSSNADLRPPRNCLRTRSKNLGYTAFNVKSLQKEFISNMTDDPWFWAMITTLPIVYGSVHLAAWNFEFPSETEKVMWRVACTLVAGGILGCFLIWAIIYASYKVLSYIFESFESVKLLKVWVILSLMRFEEAFTDLFIFSLTPYSAFSFQNSYQGFVQLGYLIASMGVLFIALLLLALYFSARAFIILESFISIRKLPLGVLVTVNWADYIPHL